MRFFAFYDKKAGLFGRVQHFPHVAEALRATERAVNDPQTFLNQHPSDYDLYEVGFFDPNLGHFVPSMDDEVREYPYHVCAVASLLKVENGGVA